jgi:hypothetical protein
MKANTKIVFYNFKAVQGWRWYFVKALTWSKHTHAHLEFDCTQPFAFVLAVGKKTQAMRLSVLEKFKVKPYYTFEVGVLEVNNDDIWFAHKYPKLSAVKMIWYQAIGRHFGMKRPASCVTFICDFLKSNGLDVPDLFTPQQLWESLHASNNVRWQSQSGQDNAGQVAQ